MCYIKIWWSVYKRMKRNFFTKFAKWASVTTGHPIAFLFALIIIFAWAITGPLFHFSNTWQLVVNTGTTIITFLMVFLIQNTQNRDSKALQIKLDELIRVTDGTHNVLLDLEELNDNELEKIRNNYEKLAKKAREELRNGKKDTDTPEVDQPTKE
jgi:low affinity Fe/Cu permease